MNKILNNKLFLYILLLYISFQGKVNSSKNFVDVYRAMKNVQFHGNTGWVQFNNQGYRTNVAYDIVFWYKDVNGSTNKMLLAEYHNNKLTLHYTGWPPPEQISDMLELKIAKNIPLRISVLPQEPYVTINKNSVKNNSDETCALGWPCVGLDGTHSCCTGYCIDLLKLLMREVGFSATIQVVKDGKYGALNHTTGKWSGLIGEVVRGEADIALSDLIINEQRSNAVDFTHPYMDTGMGVLVKVARRGKNNWTGFMDPFSGTLWIALIICINTALLFMWLLERYSPFGQLARSKILNKSKEYSFDLIRTIWFTWSLVLKTFDVGCKPKSFSCRILVLFFAFSMLIVITSYTANLAAFRVVEEEILPLSDAGIRDRKVMILDCNFMCVLVSLIYYIRWQKFANVLGEQQLEFEEDLNNTTVRTNSLLTTSLLRVDCQNLLLATGP